MSKIRFLTVDHPPAIYIDKMDVLNFLDDIDKETSKLAGSKIRMGRKKVTDKIREEVLKCERK